MDHLPYPNEPPTATSTDDSQYIYDHNLNSDSLNSPPPTASSATMSIPLHSAHYYQDHWYQQRSTTDSVLSRPKSMHSDIDPHEQVFSQISHPYNQRLLHTQDSYATYRSHIPPASSYSDLPPTSSPLGAGSVRAPSPTNSTESSSVIGRPPNRNPPPSITLPDMSYSSSDVTAYSNIIRVPTQQTPWMHLESQSPAYNGVFIDPSLRHVDNDHLQYPSVPTTAMTLREPSASPEPDSSSPSLHPTFGHAGSHSRPQSSHSPSANGYQNQIGDGHREVQTATGMSRVSPSNGPFQYPASPSYPQTPSAYTSYPPYRNNAPVYSTYTPQVLQPTSVPYPYHPPSSRDGPALPPSQPITEAPVNPPPSAVTAPPPPPANQVTTTRTNSKTKTKLTDMDRKFICVFAASHPKARQEDIATKFAVERSTVSKILKCKEKWMKVDFFSSEARTVKHRPSKFPEIEAELIHHIRMKLASREPINDSFIKKTALALADERGIGRDKFKASSGWVENFKHRHDIRRGGVFSSGDRPGAIPIPGAVLSVPGNGGSLPADGSSGLVLGSGTPYDAYDAPPTLSGGHNYNEQTYDSQHHTADNTPTMMRHSDADFPHYRSGMKTRSMRSDSFASQRPSTMSSVNSDIRDPSQDFAHGDRNGYDTPPSTGHSVGPVPFGLGSTVREGFNEDSSQEAAYPDSYPSSAPLPNLVASPLSAGLPHLPGSPIPSPGLISSRVASPIPSNLARTMPSFGSSPMGHHLDAPASNGTSMLESRNGRPLTAPHSPRPFGFQRGSFPRRNVTFSEFSHGGVLKGGHIQRHVAPDHGQTRSASVGLETVNPFDHGSLPAFRDGHRGAYNGHPVIGFTESPAPEPYRIPSAQDLKGLLRLRRPIGEPLIAEYGCDEPPYDRGFIGDSALVMGQMRSGKDDHHLTPSTTNITIE